MGQISEQKKKEYSEKFQKNKKIVFYLRIATYINTVILFALVISWFIFGAMLDKHNLYTESIAIQVAIILFGVEAILLTQINPRVSASNNTKGDRLILCFGIIITVVGIGYLIYSLL